MPNVQPQLVFLAGHPHDVVQWNMRQICSISSDVSRLMQMNKSIVQREMEFRPDHTVSTSRPIHEAHLFHQLKPSPRAISPYPINSTSSRCQGVLLDVFASPRHHVPASFNPSKPFAPCECHADTSDSSISWSLDVNVDPFGVF